MKKLCLAHLKYLAFLYLSLSMVSCEKEHLQPDPPPGNTTPLVYISATLNHDSIYLAGGLASYVGSVSVSDILTFREFNFTLKSTNNPFHSQMEISINNYQNEQGVLQADLDHSIFPGTRHYQNKDHFIPLAANVTWFDPAGIKFSSDATTQNTSFKIISVEDIIFESKPYKKAMLEFECNLADPNGHIIHLTEGRATALFGVQ